MTVISATWPVALGPTNTSGDRSFSDPRGPLWVRLRGRGAWARLHIPQYADLARTIDNTPIIQDSIGRLTAIAPASGVQHVTGLDMDGVAMRLVLDVIGERGVGTLSVNCTIDRDVVFDWQPAIWGASGKTTEITTVPNQLRRNS
jgi:hypothetical protein